MIKIATRPAILGLVLTLGSAAANAAPTEFVDNGHFYEVILLNPGDNPDWDTANAAAASNTLNGAQGHLATITSAEEDEFIRVLAANATKELWVGGFQPDKSAEPGGGWQWINGEGVIPATNPTTPEPPYANWLNNEPNNLGNGEAHLGIGLGGNFGSGYGWNDEGNLGNIGGYVVEYDIEVVEAATCVEATGCNPTGAQNIVLPPTVVLPPNATISQTRLTLTDPRVQAGTCGFEPLIVDIPDTDNDLTIPEFLCGSPDFVVLITQAPGIEFLDGTIEVENEPGVFFANPLSCDAPIVAGSDPQQQDVVVWQPTVVADILELRALELTDSCGSSRGRTRGLSYFAVGMHIDFGIDFADDPAAVGQAFVDLTRTKLGFMNQSLVDARSAMSRRDFKRLSIILKIGIRQFDRGRYQFADWFLKIFLHLLERTNFDTSSGFNHFGDLRMRVGNILFTLEVKVIPFAD